MLFDIDNHLPVSLLCHIINFKLKNTMEINYYRKSTALGSDESWHNCQFTPATNLSDFTIKTLVTINGQPILRTHHTTYLTGKETCHAHHFAKHLAIQVLNATPIQFPTPPVPVPCAVTQSRPHHPVAPFTPPSQSPSHPVPVCSGIATASSPSSSSSSSSPSSCKVLWIDTLHGPHISARIYSELASQASNKDSLHFVCLDILGGQRDNHYMLSRNIEALIKDLSPTLVVIDDIDHLMPFCGINIASEFCRVIRDVVNHTDTAFLFIGYNHLGKKASTTGNLGKYLFLDSSDIFTLTTQRDVTTVRLINSYDMSRQSDDTLYSFTIGDDNLPHQAQRHPHDSTIDLVPSDPSSPVPCAVTPSRPRRPVAPTTPPSKSPSNPVSVCSAPVPVCSGIATASSPSSPSCQSRVSSVSSASSASSESTSPLLPRGLRKQHEPCL